MQYGLLQSAMTSMAHSFKITTKAYAGDCQVMHYLNETEDTVEAKKNPQHNRHNPSCCFGKAVATHSAGAERVCLRQFGLDWSLGL